MAHDAISGQGMNVQSEIAEMIEAGVEDNLSSAEIAGNVMLIIEQAKSIPPQRPAQFLAHEDGEFNGPAGQVDSTSAAPASPSAWLVESSAGKEVFLYPHNARHTAEVQRGELIPLYKSPAAASAAGTDAGVTHNVGRWLSAALDDPQVCQEMKNDILAWMEAGKPNVQPHSPADRENEVEK